MLVVRHLAELKPCFGTQLCIATLPKYRHSDYYGHHYDAMIVIICVSRVSWILSLLSVLLSIHVWYSSHVYWFLLIWNGMGGG